MATLQNSASAKRWGRRGLRGGSEPKQKRARSLGVDSGGGGGGSSAPATAPASLSRAHTESAAAPLVAVTVDPDALDCGLCCLPLKPPIFQCDVGHVLCSPCRDKLQARGKCHVCGVATGNYRRCIGMEQLLGSIRVPCSYAVHGCALNPAYHEQESHRKVCMYVPCHCPGEACSFVGSTTALLDHFNTLHRWPCSTGVKPDRNNEITIGLYDGFNFLLADFSTGKNKQGATARIQYLLMFTMVRRPDAHNISVHWIGNGGGQGLTSKEIECRLWYSLDKGSIRLIRHYQSSLFTVACTDLSNGLPKPHECYQFVVPNSVIGDHDQNCIKVKLHIPIR